MITTHVIPIKDEREHCKDSIEKDYPMGPWLVSKCKCGPRIEKKGEGYLVYHRSYDGREAIEEAAVILDLPFTGDGWEISVLNF